MAILATAEVLFDAQGYVDTTLDQIAGALGVTKPFIYYYFRNKLEIFEVLTWQPLEVCYAVLDFDADDARPAHEKVARGLEDLIRATIDFYPSSLFSFREPQVFSRAFQAAHRRAARAFYDKLAALMEEARAEGTLDFRETRVTAQAACSLPGFLSTWYRPQGRLGAEAMVAELSELAWRVIGLKQGDQLSRPAPPRRAAEPSRQPQPVQAGPTLAAGPAAPASPASPAVAVRPSRRLVLPGSGR